MSAKSAIDPSSIPFACSPCSPTTLGHSSQSDDNGDEYVWVEPWEIAIPTTRESSSEPTSPEPEPQISRRSRRAPVSPSLIPLPKPPPLPKRGLEAESPTELPVPSERCQKMTHPRAKLTWKSSNLKDEIHILCV